MNPVRSDVLNRWSLGGGSWYWHGPHKKKSSKRGNKHGLDYGFQDMGTGATDFWNDLEPDEKSHLQHYASRPDFSDDHITLAEHGPPG